MKEYIVIKTDGTITEPVVSSERPIYTVMCYVPQNNYSRLESFVEETKRKMKNVFPLVMYIGKKNVFPLVMYIGNETPSFYDEEIKAHMISFQYQGCRKLENW